MLTHSKQDICHRKAIHMFVFIKYLLRTCCEQGTVLGARAERHVGIKTQEAQVEKKKKRHGLNIGRANVELISICKYSPCATYFSYHLVQSASLLRLSPSAVLYILLPRI